MHTSVIQQIISLIDLNLFGKQFLIRAEKDCKNTETGRTFIQITYKDVCRSTGNEEQWNGRKWYLSEFMTEDEVVKTCYAAWEAVIKHEVMEGFKVNGIVLFNPHIDYKELLKISHKEVKRV